jgi:hypothetical protein
MRSVNQAMLYNGDEVRQSFDANQKKSQYIQISSIVNSMSLNVTTPFLCLALSRQAKWCCLMVQPRMKASIDHPTYEGGINSVLLPSSVGPVLPTVKRLLITGWFWTKQVITYRATIALIRQTVEN